MLHNHPWWALTGVIAMAYALSFVAIYFGLGLFVTDTSPEVVTWCR